jgi:hypothetical protein
MIAPKTPVAVAKGRGNDQMPAPTIEPTTIMVSANSENFCVRSDATAAAAGAPTRTCWLSIGISSQKLLALLRSETTVQVCAGVLAAGYILEDMVPVVSGR